MRPVHDGGACDMIYSKQPRRVRRPFLDAECSVWRVQPACGAYVAKEIFGEWLEKPLRFTRSSTILHSSHSLKTSLAPQQQLFSGRRDCSTSTARQPATNPHVRECVYRDTCWQDHHVTSHHLDCLTVSTPSKEANLPRLASKETLLPHASLHT